MIKAKELRIGNLLTHDARTCSVTSLIENGESNYDIETRFVKGGEVRFNSIIYVGLEPIPLTEEWLIRFGFVCVCDIDGIHTIRLSESLELCVITGSENETRIEKFIASEMSDMEVSILINTNYIHQLQNLYFALTGEELTIRE